MHTVDDTLVTITVDNRKLETYAGRNLLSVCLENDIYIPHLCFLEGMDDPPASCRLCLVEVVGENAPVASCRYLVRDGIEVRTDSEELLQLRQTAFRLLVSTNDGRCHLCLANHRCELQRIAKFLHQPLRTKRLRHIERNYPEIITEHPYLVYEPKKCVLCGRCVYVCGKLEKGYKLDFAKRGIDTVVSFFGSDIDPATSACRDCLACAAICPVGALNSKKAWQDFTDELKSQGKL
ncbi:MAG: (2Fe-2S)-binding protein [Deltaproteobacteria bacterium]|nr:(2Fe-2S)-binding protein [Deltaproteobacteria bacterium]